MKPYFYFLVLAFLASGCGSDEKNLNAENQFPIKVQVNTVQVNENNPFVTASGKIEAVNSAELSTRMMGFADKIHVRLGEKVKKGQLLISINNADLQAKRAQAHAGVTAAAVTLSDAEKDYNRFQNLFSDSSASQKELDNMKANYEMAKARLDAAHALKNEVNAQFGYTNITAPFDGIITNTFIDEGDMANPGAPLLSLESLGIFEVTASLPESEISQITTGIAVDVLVKSVDGSLKGKVVSVSTSSKNTGGQYLVKITLDKTEVPILSGMFVTVRFPVAKKAGFENRVLIPKQVLITRGELSGIYTVSQNGTALLRWLRLGRDFGDSVEVLSGLSAEESYIVSSEGKLYDGAKLAIQ